MRRVFDCFTFYNELQMLRFRLEELRGVVDCFVLVEGRETFTKNPKSLHFRDNREEFDRLGLRIESLEIPNCIDRSAWQTEAWQRNHIANALERLNPEPSDIVIISDVDEIPDPDTVSRIRDSGISAVHCLEQDMYYYNLECRLGEAWRKAKIMPFSALAPSGGPETVRMAPAPVIQRGGWHLSYFGGPDFISNKIDSFSHQEYNNERFNNREHIETRMREGKDIFGRSDVSIYRVPIVENCYLPKNLALVPKDR